MASVSRLENDYSCPGDWVFNGTLSLPPGTVTNDMVNAGAAIAHTKAQHRYQARSIQNSTDAVVAKTEIVHYAYRPATVLSGYIVIDAKATSTGRTVTVNVRKSTAGSTWATILTAALTKNSTNTTARTAYSLTLSGTPTLIQGDKLQTTVAVAGSTGTQAKGLLIALNVAEDAA